MAHSYDKMSRSSTNEKADSVRGSDQYVWFTGEKLGRGAMGTVYLARHRRRGEKCAAKVYNTEARTNQKKYIQREVSLWQSLPSHETIVCLLAVEQEHHCDNTVVIMELCQGGSLQEILDTPAHLFGLQEDDFTRVFQDIFEALRFLSSHNVVHRDVKPGNILQSLLADGRHRYKLTDFGTAKQLEDSETGTPSLCGTEEYLHPDVHYSAFQRRVPDQVYGHRVDIWSFCVTLYQCATGRLPFKPHCGIRNNRLKMYDLMTKKQPGSIQAIEQDDGTIVESRTLPDTCQLFSGTRTVITELLAKVFNTQTIIDVPAFFQEYSNHFRMRKLHLFCASLEGPITRYVPEKCGLARLQEEIASETQIPAPDQLLYHRNLALDTLLPNSDVTHYVTATEREPLLLVSSHETSARDFNPPLPRKPDAPLPHAGLSQDVRWVKEMVGMVMYLLSTCLLCVRIQLSLHSSRTQLLKDVEDLFSRVARAFEGQQTTSGFLIQQRHLAETFLSSTPEDATVSAELRQCVKDIDTLESPESAATLQTISQGLSKFRSSVLLDQCAGTHCEQNRCQQRCEIFVKEATDIYSAVKVNRSKEMEHNDLEILKFNKSSLKRILRDATNLVQQHCIKGTQKLFTTINADIQKLLRLRSQLLTLDQDMAQSNKHRSTLCQRVLKALNTMVENSSSKRQPEEHGAHARWRTAVITDHRRRQHSATSGRPSTHDRRPYRRTQSDSGACSRSSSVWRQDGGSCREAIRLISEELQLIFRNAQQNQFMLQTYAS